LPNSRFCDSRRCRDADNDTVHYSFIDSVAGMTIGTANGIVQWTPVKADIGSHNVRVLASDGKGGLDTLTWTITVTIQNAPPVFTTIPVQMVATATVGTLYCDTVVATDADGDAVHYVFLDSVAGMILGETNGIVEWTPASADTGVKSIAIRAMDAKGGFDTLWWDITVGAPVHVNTPPEFTSKTLDMTATATVGVAYTDTVHAVDLDKDPITFAFKDSITGMVLKDSIITWTPANADTGNKSVAMLVKDVGNATDSLRWNIRVLPQHQPPRYPVAGYDTVITGEINPSIEVDRYQFEGVAGDKVSLRLSCGGNLIATVTLLDSSNGVVSTKSSNGYNQMVLFDTISLPRSETYMIQIKSVNGGTSGTYSFMLYSRQKQVASSPLIQYDQAYNGTISPNVKLDSYLIQGTAGDLVSLRVAYSGNLVAIVTILDASNGVVATKSSSGYTQTILFDTVSLPRTETYMIQVKTVNNAYSGPYSFMVYSRQKQVASSPIIQYELAYNGTISPNVKVESYLIQSTAGDLVSLRVACSGNLLGTATILDAANRVVATKSTSGYTQTILIDAITLPRSETYMIQIKSLNGLHSGTYTMLLTRN
jgi:hypothetical protein